MTIETDIAIVGGGMAGAALALALAQQTGLRLTLIEAKTPDLSFADFTSSDYRAPDSRVVALNAASIEWLSSLGVWPSIVANAMNTQRYACPYQKMEVWDGEGTGAVSFDAAEVHQKSLGWIVENAHIVRELWLLLQSQSNVQIITDSVVDSSLSNTEQGGFSEANNRHLILSSGNQVSAKLVVAADGARSIVRDMAGIDTHEKSYEHVALVATVQTELDHQQTAYQRFSQTGPLAFLPLSDDEHGRHYSAIVWSQKANAAKALAALDDADFSMALERAIESRLGKVENVYLRASLPLSERHARSYIAPCLALIGDAAHTIHPLAGQGVNLGFADTKALFDEVVRAIDRELPINHASALDRYQRQRRTHNAAAIYTMKGFKELFELQHPAMILLRNESMRLFGRLPFIKKIAMKAAAGLSY